MVSERVPVVIRGLAVLFSIISVSIVNSGDAKSCHYGDETYTSKSQINFMLATGVLVILFVLARIAAFDIKKLRLPSVHVLVAFDAVFLLFTFCAAIGVALSPVGSTICTGDNDIKELLQQACDVNCSNVVGSVVTTFLVFVCFLASLLFTTNVISTSGAQAAAARTEDFTFGETGTPRARKIKENNANTAVGQV